MGTDINGWIEYRDVDFDSAVWFPAMKLEVVYVGRDYDTFGYFFGIKKWWKNQLEYQPIAAGRGLPEDISSQVKNDVTGFARTWITWHEIKNSDWKRDTSWDATARILEILGDLYGDENIRLVVGFEN